MVQSCSPHSLGWVLLPRSDTTKHYLQVQTKLATDWLSGPEQAADETNLNLIEFQTFVF